MRVVLDTNIYISAILFGGTCEKVLEKLSQTESLIFISPFILKEMRRTFNKKFGWSESMIRTVFEDLEDRVIVIKPEVKVNKIKDKADDNKILECALAAKADFLISGDRKHILFLKQLNGIKILSPRRFLESY